MKEYLREVVRAAPPMQANNAVREYLQARILGCLQRVGAMVPLAFQGGTALRLLYALPRFSEDLDFALERPQAGYDLRRYLLAVRTELAAEGYGIELKISDGKAVHGAFVRFVGLPYELGLSPRREEVLAVKLEVDTDPPAGAGLATTIVRRHVVLQLHHHDRASLLAGKLHAVLCRPHTKGRDLYDLLWYLSDPDWPSPNLTLLNNALRQTGWGGELLSEARWRKAVGDRLAAVRWAAAVSDVRPFLEPSADPSLLTRENLLRLLSAHPKRKR